MRTDTQDNRGYGFAVGLLTGTFVGAGLMMWLAPRTASEVRQRVADSAKGLGKRASDGYQQASARVAETVDELAGLVKASATMSPTPWRAGPARWSATQPRPRAKRLRCEETGGRR